MDSADGDDLKTAIDLKDFLHRRKEDIRSDIIYNFKENDDEDEEKKLSDESEDRLIEELFDNFSVEDGKASDEEKKVIDELLDDSLKNAEYDTFDDISKASPLVFLLLIRKLKRVLAEQEIYKLKKIIDGQKKEAIEKEFTKRLRMLMEHCFILWISMSPTIDKDRKLNLLSRSFVSSPDVAMVRRKIVKDLRSGRIKEKNILALQTQIVETIKSIGLHVEKQRDSYEQRGVEKNPPKKEEEKEKINTNFRSFIAVKPVQEAKVEGFAAKIQPQKPKPKFVDLIKEPRPELVQENLMVRSNKSEMPDPRKTPSSTN